MDFFDVVGMWFAVFVTLCIYSFLFKDNPLYKFTEHLFVGVSAGYWVSRYTKDILVDKLFTPLFSNDLLLIIPLVLGIMMLLKLVPNVSWASRWPIAFIVGTTLGISITARLHSDVLEQMKATIKDFQPAPYVLFEGADQVSGNKDGNLTLEEMNAFKKELSNFPPPLDLNEDKKLSLVETKPLEGYEGIPKFVYELCEYPYLFNVDIKYISSLNNIQISEELKEEFKKKNIDFSTEVSVEIQEKDSMWLIKDKEQYLVKKETSTLNIYLYKNEAKEFILRFTKFRETLLTKVREVFTEADKEKKGKIAKDEWVAVFKPFITFDQIKKYWESRIGVPVPQILEDLFIKADKDKNGTLSTVEWKIFAKSIELGSVFDEAFLTRKDKEDKAIQEFNKWFKSLTTEVSLNEITQKIDFLSPKLVEQADKDHDGKLSKEEQAYFKDIFDNEILMRNKQEDRITLEDTVAVLDKFISSEPPKDYDDNGKITWTEAKVHGAYKGLKPELFDFVDKNHDKMLSPDEIATIQEARQRYPSAESMKIGSSMFAAEDFVKPGELTIRLRDATQKNDPLSLYLKEKLSKEFQKQIEEYNKYLFSVDIKFYQDLDNLRISEKLMKKFRNNEIPLSQNASVEIQENGNKWVIKDTMTNYQVVKQSEGDALNIYYDEFSPIFLASWAAELNRLLSLSLYNKELFEKVKLSGETKELIEEKELDKDSLIRLNRLLIEDAYPNEIAKSYRYKINPYDWRTVHIFSNDFFVFTIGFFNGLCFVIGVTCGLIYFFFSKEHTGTFGMASRVGIYFLMVCFGASFGYTVMARISLLIGRMIDLIVAFKWIFI